MNPLRRYSTSLGLPPKAQSLASMPGNSRHSLPDLPEQMRSMILCSSATECNGCCPLHEAPAWLAVPHCSIAVYQDLRHHGGLAVRRHQEYFRDERGSSPTLTMLIPMEKALLHGVYTRPREYRLCAGQTTGRESHRKSKKTVQERRAKLVR